MLKIHEYLDIADSRDLLAVCVRENLASYYIKRIPEDDLHLFRAFEETLEATISQDISKENGKENLEKEMCVEYYQCAFLPNEDPSESYNSETSDVFLGCTWKCL